MTSLHRVTEATKKLFVWLGIGTFLIIILVIIVQTIKSSLPPPPPPPPTVSFGQLSPIPFPDKTLNKGFTYTVNTLTGQFPAFGDRATVFQLDKPVINLLSLQQATDIAAQNGYSDPPTKISDTVYQWQQSASPSSKLIYNIVTQNYDYTLNTNYLLDTNVLAANNLPDQVNAINNARNFFSSLNSDFGDIDMTKTQTTLFSIQGNSLIPASSYSNTNVIQVDFFQNDLNKLPMYYPNYPHSIINAFVTSINTPNQIAEAHYAHQKILLYQNATYPIKTADQAFAELKNNSGFIANYDGTDTNITITNVFLAYYVGTIQQDYLMPIIVFQGKNNFYAYVSAIKNEWVSTVTPTPVQSSGFGNLNK